MPEATPQNPKLKVRRVPSRGKYDAETINEILDAGLVAHVGIIEDQQPIVIPMIYGRIDNTLYLHGSRGSRLLKSLEQPTCIGVTIVDGVVFARSVFHHSMNYRSVVVMATGKIVTDADERMHALKAISDQIMPGRWEDARSPNDKELKATQVVAFPLDEASAKIRTGPPSDEKEDYELDIWAGVLPLSMQRSALEPDPKLKDGVEIPEYLLAAD